MRAPIAVTKQALIAAAIKAVERKLKPDVAYIRYDIDVDHYDEWAIFFRIVLSDEASENRLLQTAERVTEELGKKIDYIALGIYPYHNFRNVSEQAALREPAWA